MPAPPDETATSTSSSPAAGSPTADADLRLAQALEAEEEALHSRRIQQDAALARELAAAPDPMIPRRGR